MSSMQPLEYVSRASRLDRILRELLHQTPGVEAAAVVSFDGLPMASALPPEMDEDRVAAMSAALLSLAERAAQGLGRGDLSQVYIEGENGTVFLVSAQDEGVLIAVTAADAKVGMMLYEVKLAANRVGEVLHGPAPLPAPLPSHVTRGYLDAQDSGPNGRYPTPQEEPLYSELSHREAPAEPPSETLAPEATYEQTYSEILAPEATYESTYSELDYSSSEYGASENRDAEDSPSEYNRLVDAGSVDAASEDSASEYSASEYSASEYSASEYSDPVADGEAEVAEPVLADAGFADLASEDATAEEAYSAHSPTDIPTTVAEYIDAAYAGTSAAALVENEPAFDESAHNEPEQIEPEFGEPPTTEHVYGEPSYYAESPEPPAPEEPAGWSSYAPSGSVLPGQGSWS
jgi:uncharacterized protein